MRLETLSKLTVKTKKRIGRGIGSGKGKTGGRGTKGQKARRKIPASFTGGGLPLYKKLPFKRGWGNAKARVKPIIIKTSQLNNLKASSVVSITTLVEAGLAVDRDARKKGVKILVSGEVNIPLTIELPVSKKVRELVEKAGGKVVS